MTESTKAQRSASEAIATGPDEAEEATAAPSPETAPEDDAAADDVQNNAAADTELDKKELVERVVPEPGAGKVRIKVEACGVCHSDVFVKEGVFPDIDYPRVPGHEVAGRIDKLGPGVTQWEEGARVGVGWHGGHCFTCALCRAGDFVNCENGVITAISRDGGYAEFMLAEEAALARIPDDVKSVDAAPLLCAGVTTFNSLRNSGARAGELVAIQGVGDGNE